MTVFKYIEDKDMFSRHYSKLLSKRSDDSFGKINLIVIFRLIYNISASEDAENEMISKLKGICGMEYTRKLSEMIKEAKLSQVWNSIHHLRDELFQFAGDNPSILTDVQKS